MKLINCVFYFKGKIEWKYEYINIYLKYNVNNSINKAGNIMIAIFTIYYIKCI